MFCDVIGYLVMSCDVMLSLHALFPGGGSGVTDAGSHSLSLYGPPPANLKDFMQSVCSDTERPMINIPVCPVDNIMPY